MSSNGRQIQALVIGGNAADRDLLAQSEDPKSAYELSFSELDSVSDNLERLKDNGFQVVLIGRDVAGGDPASVLVQVKRKAPGVGVVFFGGPENDYVRQELIKLGAEESLSSLRLRPQFLERAILRAAQRKDDFDASQLSPVEVCRLMADSLSAISFDGVFAYDLGFRFVLWNPVMESIFGFKSEDVIGKPVFEVLPFLSDVDEDEIYVAVRSGKSISFQERPFIAEKTKKKGCFESRYSPVKDENGKVVAVLGVFKERALSRLSERQFKESEERFHLMADVVPALIWMADRDGRRTFFNKPLREFMGMAGDEDLAFDERIHPQDLSVVKESYSRAVATRSNFSIEYRVRLKDGQYKPVLDTGNPLIAEKVTGENGGFIGYVGLLADISETGSSATVHHKRAISRAPNTVENAPIGFWKLEKDFCIAKVNATVLKQIEAKEDAVMGKNFFSVVGSISSTAFDPVLASGERIHIANQVITLERADETIEAFWDIAAWPLKNDDDEIVGVSVSTMEVTERQRLMQQREDFVATLVHDLKTPLIGADKTLESLMSGSIGELDSGQSDVLSMLRRSNQQLLMMIQNLIEFYRYDANRLAMSFEPVSIVELIAISSNELSALAKSRSIALTVNLSADLPRVRGDSLALRRVFANLLDNALKFTPSGGSVDVSGEADGGKLVIHIKDSGIGIPKEEKDRLFQRFFQGEKGKKYAVGTGLGLYLSKEILRAHRGTVNVESKENEGSTFTVVLPVSAD